MEKILLIDDDEDLLISLTEYLENSHYVVITAKNGKEGLDLLEKFFDNISLVITDVRMPIIGGVEVCRKIRSIDKFKNLPILILTTMTDISDKYIGFTSGANDYLTKPFEPL
ncbi:MAG: response regulator, partial [Candidatus Sericytochromatia bacterium]|nr:response regulator [Candidatus Sericytochromatia bacterium]